MKLPVLAVGALLAGAASAQDVSFTAVEANGTTLTGEITVDVTGDPYVTFGEGATTYSGGPSTPYIANSYFSISNGVNTWTQPLESVSGQSHLGPLDLVHAGGYTFSSNNLSLSILNAVPDSVALTGVPTSITLSNFQNNTFTYSVYNTAGQVVKDISAVVTSVSVSPLSAPEIDPNSASAALALLIGGCLVVRGKKAKGASGSI